MSYMYWCCDCISFKCFTGFYELESALCSIKYEQEQQIIIKNVPFEECEQCGAKYYSNETARQLDNNICVTVK